MPSCLASPRGIEQLNRQRRKVREELQRILTSQLEQLESFGDDEEEVARYDYDELFQKIDLSEPDDVSEVNELTDLGELAALDGPGESPAGAPEPDDELDAIRMELPLSGETFDQEEEDLRRKLEEGGVAYLSDGE